MTKLPVAKIAGESLKFPIMNVRALLRRTGIVLGLLVVNAGIVDIMAALSVADTTVDDYFDPLYFYGDQFFVSIVVTFIGVSVLANSAIQIVHDDAKGKTWFSFGGKELRFLFFGAAFLLFAALLYMPVILTKNYFFPSPPDHSVEAARGAVVWSLLFLAFCSLLIARLLPLYGFIALENRFALVQAWGLSKGHYWRSLATYLIIGIVTSLIFGVLNFLVLPTIRIGLRDVSLLSYASEDLSIMLQVLQTLIFSCMEVAAYAYLVFANFSAYGLIFKALREEEPSTSRPSDTSEG